MLCQWGQWHIQQGWSRKRRMIVIILQPVSLFFPPLLLLLISENRTWSAAWREVNQEPGGPLLTSFMCLSSSTFLHSPSVSFALSHPSLITAHQCSRCIWKIYLRFSPLYEKVWKPKIILGWLSAILLWESCSGEYKTIEKDEEFLALSFLRDSDPCVGWGMPLCRGRLHHERHGGHLHDDGLERIFGGQGRGARTRREWLQPPRQEIEEDYYDGGGGRGAIFRSQITSGMEGENITIITAPGMSGAKEQEVMEDR